MSILTWIEDKKRLKILAAPKYVASSTDSSKGLWTRCDKCGVILYIKHLKENQRVCFGCSYHLQMMSQERIENLLDKQPVTSRSTFRREKNEPFQPISSTETRKKGGHTSRVSEDREAAASFLDNKKRVKAKSIGIRYLSSRKDSSDESANLFTYPEGVSEEITSAPSKEMRDSGGATSSKVQNSKSDIYTKVIEPSSSEVRGSGYITEISTWRPLDETVSPCDPLKFHDQKSYLDRLRDAQERTGLQDAIQTGTGMIDGIPVALAVMDFSFMGGSMGSVVGEKITRLIEYATAEGLTLIIISASGGARMQEGVFSLMQMAKISSALQIYQSCAKLLYISILTSPTTGGVTASFAMLGDIIFAEPKALIAFAGRRVIEQTLREDLPEDFQTSEYMLHHGLVDLIVPRRFLRQAISETIRLYQNAPFKKRGRIPFGVQNPITFLTEERVRRTYKNKIRVDNKAREKSGLSSNSSASSLKKENKTDDDDTSFRWRYRDILTSFEVMFNIFPFKS